MAESEHCDDPLAESAVDRAGEVAALRLSGAHRFDPVRFHFIEALARRASSCRDDVKRIVDGRLGEALADYRERFEDAQNDAQATIARVARRQGNARHASLAELTRRLAQHSPAERGARPELKSVRYFRNTWSKLSVDRQVAQAIEQAPENAGPLNSQRLVLRSLALMREVSPDYLNRFVSYVDSLLWLDLAEQNDAPAVKKPLAAKGTRVRGRSP